MPVRDRSQPEHKEITYASLARPADLLIKTIGLNGLCNVLLAKPMVLRVLNCKMLVEATVFGRLKYEMLIKQRF